MSRLPFRSFRSRLPKKLTSSTPSGPSSNRIGPSSPKTSEEILFQSGPRFMDDRLSSTCPAFPKKDQTIEAYRNRARSDCHPLPKKGQAAKVRLKPTCFNVPLPSEERLAAEVCQNSGSFQKSIPFQRNSHRSRKIHSPKKVPFPG